MWNYIKDLLYMSKGVRRFIATEALLGIGIGIYIFAFNLHLLEIGFTEGQIGKITSVGTLVIGILAIPIGLLGSRYGRKNLLVLGIILMAIGYFGVAIGQEYYTLYFFQIIGSLGITLLITTEIQLLFFYSRNKKEETQAFSMLFAVFTLFTGVGTLIGGFLPKWIGGTPSIYKGAIIVSALFVFLTAIFRGLLLPKEDVQHDKKENPFALRKLKEQFTKRKIWVFSLFAFLIGAAFAIVTPFINIIVKFRLQWDDELVSIFLTANGFFLFLGSIMMPYLLDKLGTSKTYFIVYLTNTVLSVALFFTMPIAAFALLLLVRGGAFTMLNNLIDSQTMQAMEEEERNLFAGMRSVLRSVGGALANYGAGLILTLKNYSLPFLISGGFLFLGYVYFYLFVRPLLEEGREEKQALVNEQM